MLFDNILLPPESRSTVAPPTSLSRNRRFQNQLPQVVSPPLPWGIPQLQSDCSLCCDHGFHYVRSTTSLEKLCVSRLPDVIDRWTFARKKYIYGYFVFNCIHFLVSSSPETFSLKKTAGFWGGGYIVESVQTYIRACLTPTDWIMQFWVNWITTHQPHFLLSINPLTDNIYANHRSWRSYSII